MVLLVALVGTVVSREMVVMVAQRVLVEPVEPRVLLRRAEPVVPSMLEDTQDITLPQLSFNSHGHLVMSPPMEVMAVPPASREWPVRAGTAGLWLAVLVVRAWLGELAVRLVQAMPVGSWAQISRLEVLIRAIPRVVSR